MTDEEWSAAEKADKEAGRLEEIAGQMPIRFPTRFPVSEDALLHVYERSQQFHAKMSR